MTPDEKLDYVRLLMRKILLKDMHFSALMLFIPIDIGDEKEQAHAYTDGDSIYYCEKFFGLPEKEQMGIIVHEVLHVALQHPYRGQKLHLSRGEHYNHQLAQLCADAMVLRPIKHTPWLKVVYEVNVEDYVEHKDLEKIAAEKWTFEMLYNYLEPKANAIQKKIKDFFDKMGNDLQPKACDANGEGKGTSQFERDMAGRIWNERIKRAATAGTDPGSLLRGILGDLPISKVPWEKHFRDFMIANVMPTTTVDWSRPSRRLLASRGNMGHYEPGIQREKGVRKAGIVMDTSGSIDDKILNVFISETNTIMEQTGCEVVLIAADAAVQSVTVFKERIPRDYKPKGGGGTDFRPALKELAKHEVDCTVYLTDMCGTFPDKAPGFPVMWASICEQKPPFGKLVLVEV